MKKNDNFIRSQGNDLDMQKLFTYLQDQHRKKPGTILEKDNETTEVSVNDRNVSPE